jgi:hypothetical protein
MRLTTRRTLRNWAAVTGAAALVLGFVVTVPAPAAEAVTESDLVGTPDQFLIENVHAAGKVLEIGNERAQSSDSTSTGIAAAAIFARATTPAELAAQVVLAYPVTGAASTYVFANRDGEVLVRNENGSSFYRYLSVSAKSITEAATDPYAQWTVVNAGGGAVYLQNVQKDQNGFTPGLDMYNWKTDNGSEIQTYDAGTAAVQKWILRSLAPEVATFSGRTETGVVPTPPASLSARYSWGAVSTVSSIAWDMPADEAWNVDGTVSLTGEGTGYFGETLAVSADYLVGSLGGAVDAAIRAYAGITVKELRMLAPARVDRTVSGSETTVSAPVTWDWSAVTDATAATAGTFTVPAASVTGFTANLVVTIVATERINIARTAGVHFGALFGDGAALADGNRDRLGFSDWRSGGAANRVNPNRVWYNFDQPRQITGAGVFDLGTDSKRNIGTVTVQYRNLTGGWVDLPATTTSWPHANTTPELSLTVESKPVLATGARVVFTNKTGDTWMSLSEFEVYGPDTAPIPAG